MSQETINGKQDIARSLSLFDLIDRILDKGLVIDAYLSISVIGIKDLIVVRARIVVASIETFLRYADAMGLQEPGTNRQQLGDGSGKQPQQQLQQQSQQLQQQLQQLQQQLQQLQQQQQPKHKLQGLQQ
jgi:gas vesicle structural protein